MKFMLCFFFCALMQSVYAESKADILSRFLLNLDEGNLPNESFFDSVDVTLIGFYRGQFTINDKDQTASLVSMFYKSKEDNNIYNYICELSIHPNISRKKARLLESREGWIELMKEHKITQYYFYKSVSNTKNDADIIVPIVGKWYELRGPIKDGSRKD